MSRLTKATLLVLLVLLVVAGRAAAAENGIYVGAEVSRIDAESRTDTKTRYKLIAGYQALDWLGVEVNYVDLGRHTDRFDNLACPAVVGYPCPESASSDADAVSLSAIARWSVAGIDVYGRAGGTRWNADTTIVFDTQPGTTTIKRSGNDIDPVFGIGMEYSLGALVIRGEYEYLIESPASTHVLSIGLVHAF